LHKQVLDDGIHRPPMAGIHGSVSEGAISIVLSHAYEEDKDFGNNFLYSGCGGRGSNSAKRVPQVLHQKQTTHNW